MNNLPEVLGTQGQIMGVESIDSEREALEQLRNDVYDLAGDLPSMLGKVSNAVQLSLLANSVLITALSKSGDKEMAVALKDLQPFAQSFLADRQGNKTKLTIDLENLDDVVKDIKAMVTNVSTVLIKHKAREKSK